MGGFLQRKLEQEMNHMIQAIIQGTQIVSSNTTALIC